MSMRPIELRWRGRCWRCQATVPAGETAAWDQLTHRITCVECLTGIPRTQDRERVKALISDARAALEAARQAG
jgi:hypothetical protein